MQFFYSMISAFSMYSHIPMPQIEWKEENRRYALCFFPLIGVIIGFLIFIWTLVSRYFSTGSFLYGAVCMVLPLFITGGIHLDGYCDVTDAGASYGDRHRKMEIMSDPHIGSFSAIYMCVCLILQTAMFSEIKDIKTVEIISAGYVISRSLSGFAAISFKSAKSSGALQNFSKPAHKKVTAVSLVLTFLAAEVFSFIINPFIALCVTLTCLVCFLMYRSYAYRNYNGITGDLAGWFLQVCETVLLAAAVIGEKLSGLWYL